LKGCNGEMEVAIAQGFVLERVQFAVLGLLVIFATGLYGNAMREERRQMRQLVDKIAYACTVMDDESNYMYSIRKSSNIYLTRTTSFRYSTNERYPHLNGMYVRFRGSYAPWTYHCVTVSSLVPHRL
jgi:hypothetical protein